jgi:3-oxoacyl-(acyl-carrier-protein) synthase
MERTVPDRRRVVITGMGAITPVGANLTVTWEAVVAGRSGIAPITRFDASDYETRFAGEVKSFDAEAVVGRKDARRMDRHAALAVGAACEARTHAGLDGAAIDSTRVGVLVGTGMGSMETFEAGAETLFTQGPKRIGPFFAPMVLPNMAAGMTAIAVGGKGPCYATEVTVSSAPAQRGGCGLSGRGGKASRCARNSSVNTPTMPATVRASR